MTSIVITDEAVYIDSMITYTLPEFDSTYPNIYSPKHHDARALDLYHDDEEGSKITTYFQVGSLHKTAKLFSDFVAANKRKSITFSKFIDDVKSELVGTPDTLVLLLESGEVIRYDLSAHSKKWMYRWEGTSLKRGRSHFIGQVSSYVKSFRSLHPSIESNFLKLPPEKQILYVEGEVEGTKEPVFRISREPIPKTEMLPVSKRYVHLKLIKKGV